MAGYNMLASMAKSNAPRGFSNRAPGMRVQGGQKQAPRVPGGSPQQQDDSGAMATPQGMMQAYAMGKAFGKAGQGIADKMGGKATPESASAYADLANKKVSNLPEAGMKKPSLNSDYWATGEDGAAKGIGQVKIENSTAGNPAELTGEYQFGNNMIANNPELQGLAPNGNVGLPQQDKAAWVQSMAQDGMKAPGAANNTIGGVNAAEGLAAGTDASIQGGQTINDITNNAQEVAGQWASNGADAAANGMNVGGGTVLGAANTVNSLANGDYGDAGVHAASTALSTFGGPWGAAAGMGLEGVNALGKGVGWW